MFQSNHVFMMAVPSQRGDDFLHALGCCLKHLGGSPKIVVTDNLKASVIKADRYEPEINRIMEDFANHHGFAVIPARAGKPRDKAAVENEEKIVYRRVYAKLRDLTFFSLEEVNAAFAEKTREHNQTRMQRKEYCRQEKFLAEEKPLLKELPREAFEVKYYTRLTVSENNHVYLARDKHHYSVPYQHTGEKADVIYTRTIVRVFVKGEPVATHRRAMKPGYTTEREHMGPGHNFYRDRSPEFYIDQASKRSGILAELFRVLFEEPEVPELQYRRCDGLLSLQRETDPVDFERACRYALDNAIHAYKSIKRIINSRVYLLDAAAGGTREGGGYIRDAGSILITGATGCGKSFVASALGDRACRQGFSVMYFGMQKLLAKLKIVRLEGVIVRFFEKLAKTDLLIIDDFGIGTMDRQQQLDFLEIIEDRHARKSTIISSQLPPANWFDLFSDETIADAFMDRMIHTSHRIKFKNGESLRKKN